MGKPDQPKADIKILAVDTSSAVASVALLCNAILMGEYSVNTKQKHSQIIMLMIQDLLKNLDFSSEDIDVYAVTSGPGSFTGLRIGITTVKAMAYGANKPIIAVPSLEALAYNLPLWEGLICPIMDARNNQVFTALYRWKGNDLEAITELMGIPVQELMRLIKEQLEYGNTEPGDRKPGNLQANYRQANNKVAFVGDGINVYKQFISDQLEDKAVFAPANLMLTRAGSVALAAAARYSLGEVVTPFELVPLYLRKSQAERLRENKEDRENS